MEIFLLSCLRLCRLATISQLTNNSLKSRLSTNSYRLSARFLLTFTSTVIPGFSLIEIHEQDFCSLLDMYVFRNGASSSTRKEFVFLRIQALGLLHGSFSTNKSSSLRRSGHYRLCASFFTELCKEIFIQDIQKLSVNAGLCSSLCLNLSTDLKLPLVS
jgi:hypothetical protein